MRDMFKSILLRLSLIACFFNVSGIHAFEGGIGKELLSVIEKYDRQVTELPAEDIVFPGRDSQLESYLETAKENNLDVLIAEKTLMSDKQQLRAARGSLMPQISFKELYDHEEGSDTYITQLCLSQPLWNGQLWSGYRQKQAMMAYSIFSREQVKQTVEHNVAQAYFNLAKMDESIEENVGNLKRLIKQLKITEGMFSAGGKTRADLLCVRIAVSSAKSELVRSILNAREQALELNNLLRQQTNSRVRIRKLGKVKLVIPDDDLCRTAALANRPDIKMQEANVNIASAGVGMARQNFLPVVSLSGTYGSSGAVRIEFNLPLFTSGKNRALLSSAKFRRDAEEAKFGKIKEQAAAEVTATLLAISSGILQIQLFRQMTEAAGEKLKIERELYSYGRVKTTDLMDSFSEFADVRIKLIEAIYDYQISMSRLRRQIGGDDILLQALKGNVAAETLDFSSFRGWQEGKK